MNFKLRITYIIIIINNTTNNKLFIILSLGLSNTIAAGFIVAGLNELIIIMLDYYNVRLL